VTLLPRHAPSRAFGGKVSPIRSENAVTYASGRTVVTYRSPPDLASAEALGGHPARRRTLPVSQRREIEIPLAQALGFQRTIAFRRHSATLIGPDAECAPNGRDTEGPPLPLRPARRRLNATARVPASVDAVRVQFSNGFRIVRRPSMIGPACRSSEYNVMHSASSAAAMIRAS
jgi:hypothetical protein